MKYCILIVTFILLTGFNLNSQEPVEHESIITFYANDPRIDFLNSIHQNFDGLLHWSFVFNVENPEVRLFVAEPFSECWQQLGIHYFIQCRLPFSPFGEQYPGVF